MTIPDNFKRMAALLAEKLSPEKLWELRDLIDGDPYDFLLDAIDEHLPESERTSIGDFLAGEYTGVEVERRATESVEPQRYKRAVLVE